MQAVATRADETLAKIQEVYPTFFEGFRRAQDLFSKINSFEDIELYLLQGSGLSANTYKTYMVAVRQLYRFTEGMHPFQVTPNHLEAFHDYLVHERKIDRVTAVNKIAGLKRFFSNVAEMVPGYVSPFAIMTEQTLKKISRKPEKDVKRALSLSETQALVRWLREDKSPKGASNHSMVYFLLNTGLRAAELCSLRWRDIEFDSDEQQWTCSGVGKGDKAFSQEIANGDAVTYARKAFRLIHRRDPQPSDFVFWTVPSFNGDVPRPMTPHTLWDRIKKIGVSVTEQEIITRKFVWSPHLMRRTYATLLYKSGMRIKALQRKTRHASPDVLLKHYIDDDEKASDHLIKAFAV